jgi:hypothetical protein
MVAKVVKYQNRLFILEETVAYRREVEKVLARMKTTDSGTYLIGLLAEHKHWTLIIPFKPTKQDPVNASASWSTDAGFSDSQDLGALWWNDVTVAGFTFKIPVYMGTGKGTTVYIRYHPASWHETNKREKRIAPGNGAGEVLFHEMVHAYRILEGKMRLADVVEDNPHMDNVEELYAIMAANVYRSQRGFKLMRADHHGSSALTPGLATSEGYYEEFKKDIDKWFTSQRTFCLAMAKFGAKFNPFRVAAIKLGLMKGSLTPMTLYP